MRPNIKYKPKFSVIPPPHACKIVDQGFSLAPSDISTIEPGKKNKINPPNEL
jgi:hypothetical protein